MQSNEDEIINELLTLGILRNKNGQLTVSDNFFLVLNAGSSVSSDNLRQKIIYTIYHFAPMIEKQRLLTYAAMVEGYFLQN